VATAVSTTLVSLSWAAPSTGGTVDRYEIWRGNWEGYAKIAETTSTSTTDTPSFAGGAFLYKVRAVNASGGAFSNFDLVTRVLFADDPLIPTVTQVKRVHVMELRAAIDAVMGLAGLVRIAVYDPEAEIRRQDLTVLRSDLANAFGILGIPVPSFTDPDIFPGETTVKAQHLQELREAVK
jgi:hypothetical protein